MKSRIVVAGLAALALSACTTTNPYTGNTQMSNTSGGALVGAGTGAIVGAIAGAATGNDPRVGALIGAGIGVSVTRVGQQIILNMPSNITFAVDKATIQPQFNETLVSVGLILKKFNK